MAGKYIDNGPDLPAAKNKLIRCDGYIEMVLNGGAGGSIKLDEGSLNKVVDSSWSVANGKGNNYVSATIDGQRVAMHRLLLDVVNNDMKLEFVNGDRFDLRLRNVQSKSLGNIQRSAEQAQAEIATKLKKAAGVLKETEVRAELKQAAMSQTMNMLAVLVGIAENPDARTSDRITAANSVLNRAVGLAGEEDPITGAALPRIHISFAEQPVMKTIGSDGPDSSTLNISETPKLIPTFGS
ncbi:hypothetical protein [Caballeronia sp. AZ1_KS37]|uniref:hypothetical protein n=1 Tax=Caballeronia sp. AZ1_KS37 TaxID=2921756 RepID=UPI00202975C8|nr:hypothetical protein [Caballeronia sp. AZ1_KS37]